MGSQNTILRQIFRVRELLGNIEDLKDYHKKVFLPKLEGACSDPCKMRYVYNKLALWFLKLSTNFTKPYNANNIKVNLSFLASLN